MKDWLIFLGQNPSDNLAAQIVIYRVLGYNKSLAIICMQELVRRRNLGEEFDFENYIEQEISKIPKIEIANKFKL